MKSIALDIGSGFSKWSCEKRHGVMRSSVGVFRREGFVEVEREKHVVRYGKRAYLCGNWATNVFNHHDRQDTLTPKWAFTQGYLALIYSCIGEAFPEGYNGELVLCTGLPQAYFKAGEAEFRSRLVGTHSFSVGDRSYEVRIERLFVLPQALAIFYGAAIKDKTLMRDLTATIDIGTFTSGFAMTDDAHFRDYASSGVELGLADVARSLQQWVERHYNVKFSLPQAIRCLERGKVRISGQTRSLRSVTPTLVEPLADQLLNKLCELWQTDGQAARILVGGGGAPFFLNAIQARFKHAELIAPPEQCWRGVVDGYHAYMGIRLARETAAA